MLYDSGYQVGFKELNSSTLNKGIIMYILKSSKGEALLHKEKLIYILLSHPDNSSYSLFRRYWYRSGEGALTYKVYRDEQLIIDFKEAGDMLHNDYLPVLIACIKYKAYREAIHAINEAISKASGVIPDSGQDLIESMNNTKSLLKIEINRIFDDCI